MTEYEGIERRQCNQCGAEQLKSCMNAAAIAKIQAVCATRLTECKTASDGKTPMWAFKLLLVLGILPMLALQWGTYRSITNLEMAMEKRITVLEERQAVVRETLKYHFPQSSKALE